MEKIKLIYIIKNNVYSVQVQIIFNSIPLTEEKL